MEQTTLQEEKRDYAVLVGLRSPVLGDDSADEESLAELSALVDTAGGQAVGMILQSRDKPDPHSFIGEGKVEEVRRMVQEEKATMVIFDNDLSPSQLRVLTEMTGVQVLDRSGLILDIFAQRARTREGRLQVELAQYQYLLPRLIGMWTHLERQVALVVYPQAGNVVRLQLPDQALYNVGLLLPLGVGHVDDVEQQVRVLQLLQRGLEGLHQLVGQLADKAHGVGDHHVQGIADGQQPGGGVQGVEQAVVGGDPGPGDGV